MAQTPFPDQPDKLPIKGSFIQPYLVTSWDDDRWMAEFKSLREAGMEFIIFMHTVHTANDGITTAVYPSAITGIKSEKEVDLVENCLRNAKRANFKVFVGLNFNEQWWSTTFTPEWFLDQVQLGNKVADELIQRYKERYPLTMYGWYWVWEVDNSPCNDQRKLDYLVYALNINVDFLHQRTADMPFMLSPFMNEKTSTAEECSLMWKYVLSKAHFRDGDIFAPQDCVGAGWLSLNVVGKWFELLSKAIPETPKIRFLANVEMFDQRFWTITSLGRLKKQIELTRPYVSGFISFAYSHYYSPLLNNSMIHHAYVKYMESGKLPVSAPPSPVHSLKWQKINGTTYLQWLPAKKKNKDQVMGYHIYRNQILIADLQYDHNLECNYSFDIQEKSGKYEIVAYDVYGNESEKRSIYKQE